MSYVLKPVSKVKQSMDVKPFDCTIVDDMRIIIKVKLSDKSDKKAVVIGINPSIACEGKSDTTLTKISRYLYQYDVSEITMINLFETISTKQSGIKHDQECRLEKHEQILNDADMIVVAWGTENKYLEAKAYASQYLLQWKNKVFCIEDKKGSKPRHPSRISYNDALTNYYPHNNENIFLNEKYLYNFLETEANRLNLPQTLIALSFAKKCHDGQFRSINLKGEQEVPYIVHPLAMASQALSMNLSEDDLIAAILLHDVVEDCGVNAETLPVGDKARRVVQLVTKVFDDELSKEENTKRYFEAMKEETQAILVKLFDRCNNVSTMAMGFSTEKINSYIEETETYIMPLFAYVEENVKYRKASFVLRYQIQSILETIKALINGKDDIMTNNEKKSILKKINEKNNICETVYANALKEMGDLKLNYGDYMVTEPIDCNKELKRLPEANYDLCAALLTMLLREDHFSGGAFAQRCLSGQVKSIIDRMIELL